MENFFYSLEKDRSFKRQVKFLRAISHASSTKSLLEWQEIMRCSLPTLKGDIEYLNQKLATYLSIVVLRGGKVKPTIMNGFSVDVAISHLAKETLVYQIIDALCHSYSWSVEKTLFNLNISRTKYFNIISHMNRLLEDFNLTILTSPLRFKGEEADIRVFLFRFYSDFSDLSLILTEGQELVDRLENTIRHSLVPNLYLCYFRVNFWMSIIYIRWKCKQFISIPKTLVDQFSDCEDFLTFKKNLQQTDDDRSLSRFIPQEEWLWLYIVILDFVVYSEESNQEKQQISFSYRREADHQLLMASQKFLMQVLPEEMVGELSFKKMQDFLINMRLLSQLTSSFERIAPYLKAFIKQEHPTVYQDWKKALERKRYVNFFPFDYLEDLAVGLTILHQNTLMMKEQTKYLVIFAFQGGNGFDDYLTKKSKEYLIPSVEAKYFLEHTLTEADISQSQACLVVCNYYFGAGNTCPIIRLSNVPTDAEWNLVQKKLRQLVKNQHED